MGPSGTFSQLLRTLVAAYFVGILDLGQLEMYRHYCRCVEVSHFTVRLFVDFVDSTSEAS